MTITTDPSTLQIQEDPFSENQISNFRSSLGSRLFFFYLPMYIFSKKMKELRIATITILSGLNALTNTGPLSFDAHPVI